MYLEISLTVPDTGYLHVERPSFFVYPLYLYFYEEAKHKNLII